MLEYNGKTYQLEGSCNNCGKCCKSPILTKNPCISTEENTCKFYTADSNQLKFGHCLILGRGETPIEKIKDNKDNEITKQQIEWFNQNCPQFPELIDLAKGYKLPAECNFNIKEI